MKDYSELPDSMKAEELAVEFDTLLSPSNLHGFPSRQIADALCELADRQWHAYELAIPRIQQQVQEWLFANWSDESLDFIESAVWIAGRMGLQPVLDRLRQSLSTNLPAAIRKEIEEYMAETKGDVRDPYSSLRNLQKKE